MKKTLLILSCFTLAMASCGNDASKSTEQGTTTTTTTTESATAPATEAELPGEKLIAKSDCLTCHNKTQKIIGPSFLEIAKKYPLNDENVTNLANKIISGGKGVWGEIAMTPHPTIAPDDAKEMVKYILAIKE
ncbi:cytochrome c [Pedobacter sp. CG_S7]|uniref:c-type cytochrome n=1 Tax=Pedobacter sp. CG_S7 TaxID=3143930 RepID=UPI003397FA78